MTQTETPHTEALSAPATPPDIEQAIEETVDEFVGTLAAAASISMVAIGDRLGLYSALAELGEGSAADLARATGCNERLLLEWLSSNASAGYVRHATDYHGVDRFALQPAAIPVLADESSPTFLASAANLIRSYYTDQDQLADALVGTGAIDWADHHDCMFTSVERFFGGAYASQLTADWIPSVTGLDEKLSAGARVADVGCGHGISTALMASAYPYSDFRGFDFHEDSVVRARGVAAERGVTSDTRYDTCTATGYDGGPYDVVCFFDALHDMGDPASVIRHARGQIADDGVVFLVEAQAGDDRTASIGHPLGKWFYAASTVLCTPCALAQGGPTALGNQVGAVRWEQLFRENGFSRFDTALKTPFNLILAARP